MKLEPQLIDVSIPARPEGAVLVLHGGASRRGAPAVSPTQLSVLRMIPIARRVARSGRQRLAVFRVLNSTRGWNADHTPVSDVKWALEQVAERLQARLPTCLIGHSLGGRAALLSGGQPEVRSVVALAPWVYASDVTGGLVGREILIVHGTDDRVASPERSAALARRLRPEARVGYVQVDGGRHAMLHRHREFEGLAAEFASATLLGAPAGAIVQRVRDGELWLTV